MNRLEDGVYDFLIAQLICEDVIICLRHTLLQQTLCPHCEKLHNLNTLLPSSQTTTSGESEEVLCSECGKKSAAGRYAAHLEKCLGMGRQAALVASRKVTSSIPSSPLKQPPSQHHPHSSQSKQHSPLKKSDSREFDQSSATPKKRKR
jgi:hypothetical protein